MERRESTVALEYVCTKAHTKINAIFFLNQRKHGRLWLCSGGNYIKKVARHTLYVYET